MPLRDRRRSGGRSASTSCLTLADRGLKLGPPRGEAVHRRERGASIARLVSIEDGPEGRGEILEPAPDPQRHWLALEAVVDLLKHVADDREGQGNGFSGLQVAEEADG